MILEKMFVLPDETGLGLFDILCYCNIEAVYMHGYAFLTVRLQYVVH